MDVLDYYSLEDDNQEDDDTQPQLPKPPRKSSRIPKSKSMDDFIIG